MAVNPMRFVGAQEPPTPLSEVTARRPIRGEGSPPQEIVELAERRTLFITSAEEPALRPQQVEGAAPAGAEAPTWQVTLPLGSDIALAPRMGQTAEREDPETFLRDIDDAVSFTAYRPDWMDAMPTPRIAPQRAIPSMRRLDGRPIEPLDVFGVDNRLVFQDASWPWGLVGRVFTSRGASGTGVLVGPRVVATAGHMIPWGDSSWWMRFVPAYFDGASLHGAGVESYVSDTRAFNSSGEVAGYDWAVLRLYEPLGSSLGFFGYNGYSESWNNLPYWTIIGYPGAVASALRPSYQNGITIFDVDSDSHGGSELESQTADLTPGNSGGPMWAWWDNDPRVVGVVSGAESDWVFPASWERGNVIAGGAGLSNLIAWARTNWPA